MFLCDKFLTSEKASSRTISIDNSNTFVGRYKGSKYVDDNVSN